MESDKEGDKDIDRVERKKSDLLALQANQKFNDDVVYQRRHN